MASSEHIEERLRASLADRYRVEGEIGSGGMATVYLARDLKHHRKVAVKVLRPEVGSQVGVDRLDGHDSPQVGVVGLVDSRHAALAQEFVDPVPLSQHLTDQAVTIPASLVLLVPNGLAGWGNGFTKLALGVQTVFLPFQLHSIAQFHRLVK